MKIYEIDQAIEDILDSAVDPETGEISEEVFARLNELQMERDRKVEYVGLAIKNDLAEAEAIKAEAKRLERRAKTLENRAKRSKDFMGWALGGQKFSTARIAVSFRKSQSVEVDEWAIREIPEQYLRYKEPEPNKTEIKKALEAGKEIPGCRIVENQSVIIK